jgi:hypothetical protein
LEKITSEAGNEDNLVVYEDDETPEYIVIGDEE